jgi:hypothetical protein
MIVGTTMFSHESPIHLLGYSLYIQYSNDWLPEGTVLSVGWYFEAKNDFFCFLLFASFFVGDGAMSVLS